jgi:hypothetical protein
MPIAITKRMHVVTLVAAATLETRTSGDWHNRLCELRTF